MLRDNRAGEQQRTEQGSGDSQQPHPGPPQGQGGHSGCDPMPPWFSAKLFWCNEFGIPGRDSICDNCGAAEDLGYDVSDRRRP